MSDPRPVLYFSGRKNRHHGEAMAQGFGARCVPVENAKLEPDAPLHLIGGLQFGSLELMQQVMLEKKPYVFFDRAYFGGGPGTDRLRVVSNAHQQHWVEPRPVGRAEELGVQLAPVREQGDHILVVPPGDAIRRLFGTGDWEGPVLARLKRCSKRPVVVSHKGDPRPLSERLDNCHAVVTFTSNVAVEAVCAGVPAFVSIHSAAWPVASWLGDLERNLEAPSITRLASREAWVESLAWGQFTLEEIARGFARQVVLGDTAQKAAA